MASDLTRDHRKLRTSSLLLGLVLSLFVLFGAGCRSLNPLPNFGVGDTKPEEEQVRKLMKWHSGRVEVYRDFRTVFKARAVYLSEDIQKKAADLEIMSRLMGPEEREKFRKEFLGEGKQPVKVLVGFYTPEEEHNNLDEEDSIWIPYLKNPDGTATKATCLDGDSDNARIFLRFLNWDLSWSRLYLLCFPVENLAPDGEGRVVMVISGHQGQGEIPLKISPPVDSP